MPELFLEIIKPVAIATLVYGVLGAMIDGLVWRKLARDMASFATTMVVVFSFLELSDRYLTTGQSNAVVALALGAWTILLVLRWIRNKGRQAQGE